MNGEQITAYLRSRITAPAQLESVWLWQSVPEDCLKLRVTTVDRRAYLLKCPAELIRYAARPELAFMEALDDLATRINAEGGQPRPELIKDYVAELMRGK